MSRRLTRADHDLQDTLWEVENPIVYKIASVRGPVLSVFDTQLDAEEYVGRKLSCEEWCDCCSYEYIVYGTVIGKPWLREY